MRKMMVVIVIVVIIIFTIIGIILYGTVLSSKDTSEGILIANPQSDRNIVRIGEGINFTAKNSTGKILIYSWDFGDGNTSAEMEPFHTYEDAGWYNVTLTIQSGGGKKANSTLVIGVQRNDFINERNVGRVREFRPSWLMGTGTSGDIGPNVGQPTVQIHVELHQAVGTFQFNVYVTWDIPGDRGYYQDITSESATGTGGDIVFDYTVNPNELPNEIQKYSAHISVNIYIDQGRWGSGEITMNAVFPMENLDMPDW